MYFYYEKGYKFIPMNLIKLKLQSFSHFNLNLNSFIINRQPFIQNIISTFNNSKKKKNIIIFTINFSLILKQTITYVLKK